jgi:hypothetical protein
MAKVPESAFDPETSPCGAGSVAPMAQVQPRRWRGSVAHGTPRHLRGLSWRNTEAPMLVGHDVQVANVEVVGEAYDIAANYLKKTGAMQDTALIDDRLLEIIYKMFNAGDRSRLRLANRAISKFERIREVTIF